ncbi:MAG TPA: G/U mismatch-specific DNA glycosylase [Acidimicrobiia bacterium]|nr:G/U mismatch-specific DNA glycosylase [Acidimicrobiia bacterium]
MPKASRNEHARRPTQEELASATGRRIRDVIAPGLRVLFCGINPGLYSGAVGHHFARPGNRFWKVLHRAGFTDRELSPFDDRKLLAVRLGITNLVSRTTAAAAELDPAELRRGASRLARKVERYRPGFVAFAGMGAYRTAFRRPDAAVGRQPEPLSGAVIWLLPNPSGAQAAYQLDDLVREFRALRRAAG